MSNYQIDKITYNNNNYIIQDTISGYTSNNGTINGLSIGDTSIATTGTANISMQVLVNIFYPIGSYYETSLSVNEFDPRNGYWPGTWELEGEGQVHIGSGSTYTIGADGGAVTTTCSIGGSLADHQLIEDEVPSHNHGSGGVSTILGSRRYSTSTSTSASLANLLWNGSNTTITLGTGSAARLRPSAANTHSSGRTDWTFNNTHSHTTIGSAAAHNHTFTTTTSADLNLMQAYITVNRWHRVG